MSNKKQVNIQTSSLSTFAHGIQNSQTTKKAISTEEISLQTYPSHIERISSHHNIILPFDININSFLKHLLLKLQEKGVLILYNDEQEGQILIQKKNSKNFIYSLLDCFCICRKQGWPKGAITQSYQAISITIKRQYIDQRCRVKVRANCTRDKASISLHGFIAQTIDLIKKCLQSFKDIQEQAVKIEISDQSPLSLQIAAREQIFRLLVSNQCPDKKLKSFYEDCLTRIAETIIVYKSNLSENEAHNSQAIDKLQKKQSKKMSAKIYSIMEAIINETSGLFQQYRQRKNIGVSYLHPDYVVYSIEALFSYRFLPQLFSLYKRDLWQHCDEFYKNCQYINRNLSSKQYFDYLEVRPKYRLQSSSEPYDLAINSLRQLETALTLRQILFCVQKTFSLIKVCCLYQHDGKVEISSMDDILPVMIYVVARAQVIDFPVYVKVIDDYVKLRGIFQLEQRVTTTLYVATEDITKKLPKIVSE